MFCQACGKEILEDAIYCSRCGTKVAKTAGKEAAVPEWEYDDFVMVWRDARYHKVGYALSLMDTARNWWPSVQQYILEEYQKWLDEGWESITEVGPSALVLEEGRQFDPLGGRLMRPVRFKEFRVKMRRKKA